MASACEALAMSKRRVGPVWSALLVGLVASAACRDVEMHSPGHVYVSNEDDGTVSVIDAERGEVVATIPVGERPRGLQVSPDGRTLYVALSGSPKSPPGFDRSKLPPPDRAADGIGVVDLATRRLVATLASGQAPASFDLVGNGELLVVSNEETAQTAIVDVAAGSVRTRIAVGGEPEGVTAAPDGTVWVTCESDDRVDVVDPVAGTRLAGIAVGKRPRSIVFTRDGKRAYVANELDASVSVVDVAARRELRRITLPAEAGMPARPMGLARARDGERVYVTTGRARTVIAIDVTADEVTDVITGVGNRPWGIAAAADGKLYTANGPSNDVAVIDPERGEVIARIPVGSAPWGVAVDR